MAAGNSGFFYFLGVSWGNPPGKNLENFIDFAEWGWGSVLALTLTYGRRKLRLSGKKAKKEIY